MIRVALLALLLAGCGDARSHPLIGRRYDATKDCLGAEEVVDVLEGPDPGTCPRVRCWIDAGGTAIVTPEGCSASPDWVDHTGDAAGTLCASALAAYAKPDHGACGS